jgi:hypothetical protein
MKDHISKAQEIFDAIQAEARENATAELAEEMANAGPEIWDMLATRCGKEKAAFVVMVLLICAIDDGAIRAFIPESDADDCADKYPRVDVIDDGCILIRETGGTGLEVVEIERTI